MGPFEQPVEAGVANVCFQRIACHVGQEDQPQTCFLQRLECGQRIRPSVELELGLHQLIALVRSQVELSALGREDKRVFRRLPEVRVLSAECMQPLAFELTHAPGVAEFGALAREQGVRQLEDRSGIEYGKGIECDGR